MSEMPTTLKILANGASGTGKTTLALTFPKIGYIGMEPNGLDCLYGRPDLRANLIQQEEFLPTVTEDIKLTFERLEKYILSLHQAAKDGAIQTLVLDNLTFLSMNRWIYINKYEKQYSERTGNLNPQAMYGALGSWLYHFFLLYIISFPGNVVTTAHIQRDDEIDLKRSLTPETPITADILGSMRYRITGLVSASMFLHRKKTGPKSWQFYARCLEGDGELAKSRYPLPEVITDISYHKILEHLTLPTTA